MRALVAAATALALTACGSTGSSDTSKSTSTASAASTSSGSEAGTENTITIPAGESVSQDSDVTAMVAVDFTTMDPMDTSDTLSGGVQRMMMDGLFGFDENMQIIPMLATSYEANDEATEYTIHLREGVSFTDGTPWNADALIANVNKWADKSLGLKRTTFLCNVLDHAEKVDDYTVKIYLSQSFGAFISNLAHPATLIMSPKQIEAGEDACAQAPVGTGQYKFVEWVAGDHMKVELNKDWWGYDADVCGGTALADADAGFKSITFKPVAESATRVSAIQAGDAQIMWSVPTESVDTLKGDSNVSVGMGDSIAVWYFFMNTQKAPFNDVKVREAMAYAINKEAYIQVVMNGYGSVATSMVGEEVQHYKGNDPYSYDPEKAKELLKEAGMCFFFAQKYHTSMKYVGPIRKELGIRTVFNILGPLTNPGSPKMQLLGVYDEYLVQPLAQVLMNLGVKRGMVVYGQDRLDEISLSAPTTVCEFKDGWMKNYVIKPEDFGMERCTKADLAGGLPEENAQITRDILAGAQGPKRNAVLLNAGASLYIGGKAASFADGVKLAAELIDSGKALQTLEKLIELSNK